MSTQAMRVPEAIVVETDTRAFELRKAGLTYRQIARALDCADSRAYAGVQRTLQRIGSKLAEDNVSVIQLELDRLDTLMSNLWPMTMPHDAPTEDGGTVRLPPSFDAVDRVLKIMDRRARLLGLDQMTLNVNQSRDGVALGKKAPELAEISPKDEALKLLQVMQEAGVIAGDMLSQMRSAAGLDAIDVTPLDPPLELGSVDGDFGDGEPFFGDDEDGGEEAS